MQDGSHHRAKAPSWQIRFAVAVAALAICASGADAAEPPPAPAPGLDYRVVFRQGPERRVIEIRRHASRYLHTLPDAERRAEIHYDPATSVATIFDGDDVVRMRLGPGEIGGFDPGAMMAGLSETEVTWETGETREIAGARCTDHLATGRAGGAALTGRFCVTRDGIVLAIETGGPGRIGRALMAETLEIAPQPAEAFDMSPYKHIEIVGPDVIR